MKRSLLFSLMLIGALAVQAQYPVVTIKDIQEVPLDSLLACNDLSLIEGDTVTLYCRVVTPGGIAQSSGGYNIWVQDGSGGPWTGLDVYNLGDPPSGDDMLSLVTGDSIRIDGVVISFFNESEIDPISITLLDLGKEIIPTPVVVGDFNDANRVNDFTTGEQYEGVYVELYDATVVEVLPFSGGSRVSFNVSDADGNLMNVSDRFLVQRLPGNGGNFVAPPVGTVYDTLRGVIAHSGNGCTGQTNNRGYEMYPYQESDYIIGFSAPLISGVTRNPVTPMSSEDVTVSASIEDPDGNVVSASLFYAVGLGNNSFLELPMSSMGSTYSATIPNTAFSDGDLVKFYLSATDDSSATSNNPVGASVEPYFFTVRDDGTTIYDVQFTPFDNGNSPYEGLEVELTGIVTASSQQGDASTPGDLGYVYIQQPGQNTWAGISLVGNAELNDLRRGDEVQVRGTIRENFGLTQMADIISVDTLSSGNAIPAVEVNPDDFSDYDFATTEPYEGMLVTLVNSDGTGLVVVDINADDNTGGTSNFAEYRVGTNILNAPDAGCRVLAGRRTTSAFSSLDFSYVNDSLWITESGEMNVDPCVVTFGDTMTSMTGIMYYSFGAMKLLPRNNLDAEGYNGANCAGGIVPVDIDDELAGSEFVVFPNPSNAAFTLRYSFPEFVEATVEVRDMMGRQLTARTVKGVSGTINLDGQSWASGTYFLVIRTRGEVLATQKLLLQK